MTAAWQRLRNVLKKIVARRARKFHQGYVERVGPDDVSGWVNWSGARPPELQFVCGGVRYDVDAGWHARPDVRAALPQAPVLCGFSFPVPPDAWVLLNGTVPSLRALEVLAGGMPVRLAGPHVVSVPTLQGSDVARELALDDDAGVRTILFSGLSCTVAGRRVTATLSATTGFRVVATLSGEGQEMADVMLVSGGHRVAASSRVVQADDRRDAIFELPGHWWTLASADAALPLQLSVDGSLLPASPAQLPLQWAGDSLQRSARRKVTGTYAQLLALEHAHFLAGRMRLADGVHAWLQPVADRFGLADYLPGATPADAAADAEDAARVRLIGALREVSGRLPSAPGQEPGLLADVEQSLASERQRESLRESVLPWFYRERRLADARRLVTAAHRRRLEKAGSAWQASLVLPLLVADRQLDDATALLRALPGKPGWVVTECLAEASRQALAIVDSTPAIEKFGTAFLAFIDQWAPDYWSRREDIELIDACVDWLGMSARFSLRFRNDLFASVLRIYGLSPRFWERLEPLLVTDDPLHVRLTGVAGRFRRLADAIRQTPAGGALPPGLHDDIAYFRRAENHDVARFVRELACTHLLAADDVAPAAPWPVGEMLALGDGEAVRVAALPTAREWLAPRDAAALPSCIADLRRGQPRAPYAVLQQRLARQATTVARDEQQTEAFVRAVETLGSNPACHLSVDLLASAWCADRASSPSPRIAGVLARHLKQAAVSAGTAAPPQPLLAAIARLHGDTRLAGSADLRAAVDDAVHRLQARFPAAAAALQAGIAAVPAGNGDFADVLVVVYSCRKYLDTRVRAIRESWMKDLQARGIRCIVLVGDGDGTLNGDLLALAVGDRYEDLPAKSLAMAKWVLDNTCCQYVVKIDDDCLLNVAAYFDDLVYREFHYYGRVLRRDKGGTDRRWHQSRARDELARNALDKSPEPSSYADGGGGYSLSRFAMAQMLAAAETPLGARLVAASYMEDKLVGDLLSLAGIVGRSDDYPTLVRRRYGVDAEPVGVFENTFFPSQAYTAKLAHLDTHLHMQEAWRRLGEPGLWPKKLWPSTGPVTLEYGNANQLELLTPLARARGLLAQPLFVVSVMRNEKILLPHFLNHYRGLGVGAFIVVDNLSDDGTREMLLAQPDVVLYSADTEYRNSQFGVAWQQTILASHCLNRWALLADADELLVCPGGVDLPTFTGALAGGGHDAARVFMVDMYPAGDLAEADFERDEPFRVAPWFDRDAVVAWRLGSGAYNNAGNYVSGLRHRLIPSADPNAFTAQKYCLVRYAPWMRFCAGLHNVANARVAPVSAWFAHFKYHAGFKARVDAEVARQQHFGGAREYRRYQDLVAEGRGGFAVQDVSMRYTSAADFERIVIADDA